jgi:dienelactone hydrolase
VAAHSAVQKEKVVYQHGDTQLTGYIFWDDTFAGKRPAVMVFHEWWGLNDYALSRARMLAEAGYVAFAADMYGEGKITRHASDAKGWMQQVTQNMDVWRGRAELGLKQLLSHAKVDATKTAVVGYCFGGATALQLAYTGAKLDGVITVHGSLPAATQEQAANIKATVLVLHGASDGFVPAAQVEKFTTALNENRVDWEMDVYGGAKHAFSNPDANAYGIDGIEYNENADLRSWARTLSFLDSIF